MLLIVTCFNQTIPYAIDLWFCLIDKIFEGRIYILRARPKSRLYSCVPGFITPGVEIIQIQRHVVNWNTFWGFPISFYYQIYIWTREERFKFLRWYASKEYLFVLFFVTLNIFGLNLNNNVLFDDFEIHVWWCWLTPASIPFVIELLNKIRYGYAKKKKRTSNIYGVFICSDMCKNISEPAILKPEKRESSPETK